MSNKLLDKTVENFFNLIFSKDKTFVFLLLITLLGLILRIIAASNLAVFADDMHFAPGAIGFISSGKLEYWDQSAGLWFLLTDIFYHIFGQTQLGSRFVNIIFGTLFIPLIFLLSYAFFKNKKLSLISAFLISISPYHIKSMMAEMDVLAMFFVMISVLFFIKALDHEKNIKEIKRFILFISSGLSIGLAIYTKVYPLLFIPGMVLFFFYINYTKKLFSSKNTLKFLFVFLISAFLLCIPVLAHNYLLLKDKGMMDNQFARVFGNQSQREFYSWASGSDAKMDLKSLFLGNPNSRDKLPTSLIMLKNVFFMDPVIFVFGFIGLFFVFKRNKDLFFLLSFMFIFSFGYLASFNFLTKHYLFVSILLTIPAAFSLNYFYDKLKIKFKYLRLRYLMIIILVFSLIYLGFNTPGLSTPFYSKSEIGKMIDFKRVNIPQDSLVVVDSRVYRGQMTWMFSDRHYLEANYFQSLISAQNTSQGTIPVITYFIECLIDDCGWGTVKDQPDFNKSMESLVDFFKNNSKNIEVIKSSSWNNYSFPMFKNEKEVFSIYKITLSLNQNYAQIADSTHNWWLYPLNYDRSISKSFDDYTTSNVLDKTLDKFAHFIRTLSIFLAFLSILVLIYFLLVFDIKSEDNSTLTQEKEVENNENKNNEGKDDKQN